MQICIILLSTAMYLKDKKLHFLKYCFRMEALQSRRHCHESVNHLIKKRFI